MKRLTVATFACIALLAAGQLLRLDSIEAKRSLGTLAAHFQSKQAAKRWYPPPLANDDVWNKAKCKGNSLNQAFSMSSEQAGSVYVPPRPSAQSEFRDFPDAFHTWDYHWNWMASYARNFDNTWGISTALRSLGVSDKCREDGGNIGCEQVTHGNPLARDDEGPIPIEEQYYPEPGTGHELPLTGAHFTMGINPTEGVLIMMEKQVARMAARDHNIPTNKLPKLQRSSDIEWGMYKIYADELNGRVYNNLRYYFAISITESQTQAVVARALRNANQQLTAWPGYTFNMGDEGTAILGTRIGAAVGYMLIEHKLEMGNMRVRGMRVFAGSTPSARLCIMFYIGPVQGQSGGLGDDVLDGKPS